MPELDHVFVCCAEGAPEAEALARAGLAEGPSNAHPGQGTANRRFFFGNAYLELLWVADAEEARSEPVRRTRLLERWSGRREGVCPFGIVLRPGRGEDPAPLFPTWSYRPPYLPAGLTIEVAEGTSLREPEIFFLPWARPSARTARDSIPRAIPIAEVTGMTVGLPEPAPFSAALRAVEAAGVASFASAGGHLLTLAFDFEKHGTVLDFRPDLPLALRY